MVNHIKHMVSMARNKEQKEELAPSPADLYDPDNVPTYPYGLCISLCEEEMEKLDLDDDVEPGDTIHLFCMAKVTSVSKRADEDKNCCRVELQITEIACENEGTEDAPTENEVTKKLYKG